MFYEFYYGVATGTYIRVFVLTVDFCVNNILQITVAGSSWLAFRVRRFVAGGSCPAFRGLRFVSCGSWSSFGCDYFHRTFLCKHCNGYLYKTTLDCC